MKNSKKTKKLNFSFVQIFVLVTLIFSLVLNVSSVKALDSAPKDNNVTLYFFWGDGCPHCAHEKSFLEELQQRYPELEVKSYEVWHNSENAKFFSDMAKAFGTTAMGVPTTFLDDKVWVGYSDYMGEEIEEKVKYCIEHGCIDPIQKLGNPSSSEISESKETTSTKAEDNAISEDNAITIPILGKLDTSKTPLIVLTIILAGLDSFNPCAFFVLFFLLSMLIYSRSRKRMFLIGGTFVFFSAFIYFLFIAAWLNLFLIIGNLAFITIIAGIVALIVAVINIKDFFFFEKGISLVIPEKAKPKLFERMRNLLKATSLSSMIFGTIVLSIAANTYELLCTAGFPMVFTRILTLHNLPTFQYYFYLLLYCLIYVVPLIAIVIIFAMTLGAKKLTEWQGQVLKLISGMMMLCLGLVLIINPSLMNNIFTSIAILATALAIAGIIIFITKKVKKYKEAKEGNN